MYADSAQGFGQNSREGILQLGENTIEVRNKQTRSNYLTSSGVLSRSRETRSNFCGGMSMVSEPRQMLLFGIPAYEVEFPTL